MIDLHMHSECSTDARDTPEQLMERAAERGVIAVAITEHSNIDSLERGRGRATELGMTYINGVEIGASVTVDGESVGVDILGYFFDDAAPHIRELDARSRERGRLEADAFLAGLEVLEIPLTREDVAARYPDRVSAWAIRRMLREQGYAEDKPTVARLMERAIAAAAERSPAYAALEGRPDAATVVAALKADGATCTMAHPFWTTKPERGGYREADVWKHIEATLAAGVDGLEAVNYGNDAGYAETVLHYCREHDLPASGGTDSHGARNVGIVPIDDALLESMRRHRRGESPWATVSA